MKRLGIAALWALALSVTLFIAIVYSGCGSAKKPTTAKPEPLQTDEVPLVCLRVERQDRAEVIFCGSKEMCQHAHDRLAAFWEVLMTRYAVTGLSDCTPLTARFTER